ncbi:hypothetical protein J6590_076617, partial [Homalodisca vitripennis]
MEGANTAAQAVILSLGGGLSPQSPPPPGCATVFRHQQVLHSAGVAQSGGLLETIPASR